MGLITVRACPPAGYTAAGATAQRAATQAPKAQAGFQESNISSHAEPELARGGLSTVPQNVPQTVNCLCSPYPNTLPQSSADRPRLTRYTSIALWYHPTKCNSYMPGILQVSYAIPAQVQASITAPLLGKASRLKNPDWTTTTLVHHRGTSPSPTTASSPTQLQPSSAFAQPPSPP
jgi:hypothetical protein